MFKIILHSILTSALILFHCVAWHVCPFSDFIWSLIMSGMDKTSKYIQTSVTLFHRLWTVCLIALLNLWGDMWFAENLGNFELSFVSWGRKEKVLDLAEILVRKYFQCFQLRHVLKMFKWMTSCFILWHSWNPVTNTINVHLITTTMLAVIRETVL